MQTHHRERELEPLIIENKMKKTPSKATKKTTQKREEGVVRSLLRNIVLAVSLLVIVLFVVSIFLGIFTRHGMNKDVPNFVGSTLVDAERGARKGKLEIVVNDSLYVPVYPGGVILEQRPSAGKDKVKSGRKIYVTINASQQRSVAVPYVAGFSLRQAKSNMLTGGLEIDRLEYVEDLANNYVFSQNLYGEEIPADSIVMAPVGSKVTLVVGGSRSHVEVVPDLAGMTLREVKHTLWDMGLNLGDVTFEGVTDMAGQNAARVSAQSPLPEEEVRQGRSINVVLTLDEEL